MSRNGQIIAQNIHLFNQSLCPANLQQSATWAEQISTSRTNPSVVELPDQQQTLQRDLTAVISKLSDIQPQHKNDNFLADLQT